MTARKPTFSPHAFTVRTPEGELEYATISDLARAYQTGMIDADDEVRDGPAGPWARADVFARERALPPPVKAPKLGGYAKHAVGAIALGAVVIFLIAQGQLLYALLIAVVLSLLLSRVTLTAFRKPRR